MGKVFRWNQGRNPEQMIKNLQARQERMLDLSRTAIGRAALVVEGELEKRIWQSSRLNRQDSGTGKVTRPSLSAPLATRTSSNSRGASAKFTLGDFWTGVRVKGDISSNVAKAYAAAGRTEDLHRQGLWVKAKGSSKRGKRRFLPFSGNPSLLAWAQRADKGKQFLRHTARVEDAGVLEALHVGPAIRASGDRVREIWKRAVKEGFA